MMSTATQTKPLKPVSALADFSVDDTALADRKAGFDNINPKKPSQKMMLIDY